MRSFMDLDFIHTMPTTSENEGVFKRPSGIPMFIPAHWSKLPESARAARDMTFAIDSVHLGSVVVVKTQAIEDARGFFMETFKADEFRALGLPHEFVQDNHSGSQRGVLRGLHFQWQPPMGKLMRVT